MTPGSSYVVRKIQDNIIYLYISRGTFSMSVVLNGEFTMSSWVCLFIEFLQGFCCYFYI